MEQERVLNKEVVRADGSQCTEDDCTNEFIYGVKLQIVTKTTYAWLFTSESIESEEFYCPHHCPYENKTREAFHMESKFHNKQAFDDISSSGLLPTFTLSITESEQKATLVGPNTSRTKATFSNISLEEAENRAEEIVQNITTSHPILLVNTNAMVARVYSPNGRDVIDTFTERDACYSTFEKRYGDVEYHERDYYPIQTNSLTGLKKRQMRNYVDEVIEMSEYRKLPTESPFRIRRCPSCSGRTPPIRGVHRVKLEGKEILVPLHTWNKCKRLMGEVNADLVDTDLFDLPDTQETEDSDTEGKQTTLSDIPS